MSVVLDDGVAAISVEGICGVIRILDSIPGEDEAMPDYAIHGEWVRLSDAIVKLQGFSRKAHGGMRERARLTVRHMALIARWALGEGYAFAYVERQSGRTMPWSEQIKDGDFAGWWRGDLVAARLGKKLKAHK